MLIADFPRTNVPEIIIPGANASATLRAKVIGSAVPTVPTSAGTTEVSLIAPYAGTLTAAKFVAKDALATHATNIATWAIVNKGTGAGSTAMLAATAVNTTTTTTGTALAAYTTRTLTLHGTAANLVVAAGDCLALQVIGSGTLANTITEGYFQLTFDQTA